MAATLVRIKKIVLRIIVLKINSRLRQVMKARLLLHVKYVQGNSSNKMNNNIKYIIRII